MSPNGKLRHLMRTLILSIKRLILALSILALVLPPLSAQAAAGRPSSAFFDRTGRITPAPFATLADLDAQLANVLPGKAADAFWAEIVALGQMPLVFGDTAVFLYRGAARSVAWLGDFNTWQTRDALAGRRVGGTDIWTARTTFPLDARLDYKISVNGVQRLDPLNPLVQQDGYARNSALTMPQYFPSSWADAQQGAARGSLSAPFVLQSKHLGYAKRFRVYTPAGYQRLDHLPVLYVTDGQEFADDQMGALPTILDNLIAAGRIDPVMAVFVDPRTLDTGDNRRGPELLTNPHFQSFLTQELIPWVDARYPTRAEAAGRAIVGVSLGGLHATYTAMRQPEWFGMAAALSPYYQAKPTVLAEVEKSPRVPVRFFVAQGTYDLDIPNTRHLRDVLQAKGNAYRYMETNDGHSWGNWRGVLDDMLICFFGR